MLNFKWVWLPLLLWSVVVQADEAELTKKLEALLPNVKVDSIRPLDTTGMYEAVINGEVLYFSADGRYIFQGDVVSLETRQNVTEQRRASVRKTMLDGLNEKDMIIFEPKKTEYTLTVFTDIDCGYCRKLHSEMQQYNDLGIRIRYLSFPRGGINSKSYEDAVSVWCADDRKQAITQAKAGQTVNTKTCDNPVKQEYELGQKMGVQGTPALFLESGKMLPGYVPPQRLKEILDQESSHS